ncbi:MAG: hypothetical protein ACP5N3_01975 [Candidatus Nanoarchaeia archaeon]
MIFFHDRKRRKYLNTESIGFDLENIFLGFYRDKRNKVLFNLDEIVFTEINCLANSVKTYSAAVDYFFNDSVNNALDYFSFGKTDEVFFEEIIEEKEQDEPEKHRSEFDDEDKKVKDINKILEGKFINSYSLRDKKPRRLWKWEDRLEYVEGVLAEADSEKQKMNFEEMYLKIKNNYYLKIRHRDIYEKLSSYFAL